MNLKGPNLFLIILITLVALAGCDKAQRMIMEGVPSDTGMDNTLTDMEAKPVRLVLFIDYPEGGKDAYIEGVASVAETLQAPEELLRIRAYDNQDPEMRPHRLVEFDFKSFLDAATYLNRPEIAAIFADMPNHANKATTYTFIQDVDHTHAKEEGDWQIKHVYLIDYVPGGKQAYLERLKDVPIEAFRPTQLKVVASYDNYYGESPHRLVEFEFATPEDAAAYYALEEVIQANAAQLESQAGKWSRVLHRFQLRSDYIHE